MQRGATRSDFDGDGIADPAHFRSSDGSWHILLSTTGLERSHTFGAAGDTPVAGDYDGDGITDEAVYRYTTGHWLILQSSNQQTVDILHGIAGETDIVPIPADFDNDGKTDAATYNRATALWSIRASATSELFAYAFGGPGDPSVVPVPGDYDGDGITDPAIYYVGNGHWYIYLTSQGTVADLDFGVQGDFGVVVAPADFNGDGTIEPAFYYQQLGNWYIAVLSAGQIYVGELGIDGDPDVLPVAADYDGDSAADVTIYYKLNQYWFMFKTATQEAAVFPFGTTLDVPVLNRFAPIIGDLTPSEATTGSTVTINGIGFGTAQYGSVVRFNGTTATPTAWGNTTITVPVPAGATSGPVTVTVNDHISNFKTFDVLTPPCSYDISPTSATVAPVGGTGSVTVTAPAGCAWTANSPEAWVTVGAGGTGNGSVDYTVASHETGTTTRNATLIIAGINFIVTQTPGIVLPSITATVTPQPNAAGWNSSSTNPVVSFTCTAGTHPISFCSSATTVFGETSGSAVPGEAIDTMGNSASISVLVKVDRTSPKLTLFDPADGAFLPTGTTTATLRGSVIDYRSGLASVTCGAVTATVSASSYSCSVPVSGGLQTLSVTATDIAGNVSTKQVTLTVGDIVPTSISVSPAKMTMAVGDVRPFGVTDQAGRPIGGATLSVSNSSILEIFVEENVPHVRALATGTANVNVLLGGLAAQTIVTVNSALGEGDILWSLQPSSAAPRRGEVLRAMIIETPTGSEAPALFFINYDREGENSRNAPAFIRATTLDGRELWRYSPGRAVQHAVADNYGGLVLVLADGSPNCCNSLDDAIRRLDWKGQVSWEYVQQVRDGRFSDVALHPDGRIFVVERRDPTTSNPNEIHTDLVAFNTESGTSAGVWELGWSTFSWGSRYPLAATSPIVREDGSIVVVGHRFEGTIGQLVRFELSSTGLTEHVMSGQSVNGQNFTPLLRRLVPDGAGGLLVVADNIATIYRVSPDDVLSGPIFLGGQMTDGYMQVALGDNGAVALVQRWWGTTPYPTATVVRFNPVTLQVLSTQQLPGGPLTPFRLLQNTLQGGAITLGEASNGFATDVAGGYIGGWNLGEEALKMETSLAQASGTWGGPRGNRGGMNWEVSSEKGVFARATAVQVAPCDEAPRSAHRANQPSHLASARTGNIQKLGRHPLLGCVRRGPD